MCETTGSSEIACQVGRGSRAPVVAGARHHTLCSMLVTPDGFCVRCGTEVHFLAARSRSKPLCCLGGRGTSQLWPAALPHPAQCCMAGLRPTWRPSHATHCAVCPQVCGVDLTTAKSYCRAKKACTTCLAVSVDRLPAAGPLDPARNHSSCCQLVCLAVCVRSRHARCCLPGSGPWACHNTPTRPTPVQRASLHPAAAQQHPVLVVQAQMAD